MHSIYIRLSKNIPLLYEFYLNNAFQRYYHASASNRGP